MRKISYSSLKGEILDDFYTEMINHAHNSKSSYEEIVMGYLSYDYEEGFSKAEGIIIDIVLYIIGGKNFISKNTYEELQEKLIGYIENKDILELLRSMSKEDQDCLLHDLYLVGIINKKTQEDIYEKFSSLKT